MSDRVEYWQAKLDAKEAEVERLRALLDAERENNAFHADCDISEQKLVDENERLRAATQEALKHLTFNEWKNDPRSDRRTRAVKDLTRALEGSSDE